ncbi:hypothetical protein [Fischerella sp. PCC 9605]|uniref:hypothetical protein n=1 Tax=Fischerella sp. PCC 9605 TaxID=1173024 RepID=UPI000479699C|nr:hypothetical protein [Fischerella sp. PCC 9605]
MGHFIGNDEVMFDIAQIRIVYWNCCRENKNTRVKIIFDDGNDLYLYYDKDEDYILINNLREELGFDKLPRF